MGGQARGDGGVSSNKVKFRRPSTSLLARSRPTMSARPNGEQCTSTYILSQPICCCAVMLCVARGSLLLARRTSVPCKPWFQIVLASFRSCRTCHVEKSQGSIQGEKSPVVPGCQPPSPPPPIAK